MNGENGNSMESISKQAFELKVEYEKKLAELRGKVPQELVKDCDLTATDGTKVKLSQLFGDKEHLIFVHNMGFG